MGILSGQYNNIPLHTYHPSRATAMQLWKFYTDSVDPCVKVLHLPTTETLIYTVINEPSRASADCLGLCFAIYYAAAVALFPEDATRVLGKDRNTALHHFKTGFEQALAHADFLDHPSLMLLQALAVYLVSYVVLQQAALITYIHADFDESSQLRSRCMGFEWACHPHSPIHGVASRWVKAWPFTVRV